MQLSAIYEVFLSTLIKNYFIDYSLDFENTIQNKTELKASKFVKNERKHFKKLIR